VFLILAMFSRFKHTSFSFENKLWCRLGPGNTKGGSITVLLTCCLTGLETAVWQLRIFVFYLQNRLIQASQTGGQRYSDTSPFSIPCLDGMINDCILMPVTDLHCLDHTIIYLNIESVQNEIKIISLFLQSLYFCEW